MLSVRHIFRLCKQSAPCSLSRPCLFFSSNADDSNFKRPPKKDDSDNDSLDALLGATYSSKNLLKPAPKTSKRSSKTSTQKQASKSDFTSMKGASHDESGAVVAGKNDKGKMPLTELLNDTYNRTKPSTSDAELQDHVSSKADVTSARTINVAIDKKQGGVSSSELLNRIKKIAQDVATAAGPKSKEVAEDLLRNLEQATKVQEKPIDLHELTFEKHPKDSADQNLDLLRNKIVSEEQIYKITPEPHESQFRRPMSQMQMELREPWSEKARPMYIKLDLDVSLYPKSKIGIFQCEAKESLRTKSCLHTYEKLEQREIDLSHSYAPRNWFEQCIQWTEQGKLWHFPIDNEQGLEEGQTVSFTEHIFLEDHLEGWCPTFGPVRHFMELVCLGLSKNPYLSVEEKIENIMWYRDYFEQHRELLEAAGTLDSGVTKVPALEAQ